MLASHWARRILALAPSLICLLALTLWRADQRQGCARLARHFSAPPVQRTWHGAVVAPAPHVGCTVAVESLPQPTLLFGASGWTPRAEVLACGEAIQREKSLDFLEGYWEQHRLAHYVKAGLALRQALSPLAAAGNAAGGQFEVGLVDDEAWLNCWFYAFELQMGPDVQAPRLTERREEAVRFALGCGARSPTALSSSAVAVVLEDHPGYNVRSAAVGDRRLFRVVLDMGQVPPLERTRRQYLIAPYVAEEGSQPLPRPVSSDQHLVYFHAACRTQHSNSPGIRLRQHVISALEVLAAAEHAATAEGGLSISAACPCALGRDCKGNMGHRAMLVDLASARFCIVIAGDTPSSRRLSEVIAAGCIPVLVGVPWPALPLAPFVDYSSFAIFVRLGGQDAWLQDDDKKELEEGGAFAPDPWSAGLLSGAEGGVLELPHVRALVEHLRGMSELAVQNLRHQAALYAPYFTYIPHGGALQSEESLLRINSTAVQRGLAGSLLIGAVCAYTA
jgi:hypothetical protein